MFGFVAIFVQFSSQVICWIPFRLSILCNSKDVHYQVFVSFNSTNHTKKCVDFITAARSPFIIDNYYTLNTFNNNILKSSVHIYGKRPFVPVSHICHLPSQLNNFLYPCMVSSGSISLHVLVGRLLVTNRVFLLVQMSRYMNLWVMMIQYPRQIIWFVVRIGQCVLTIICQD